MWDRELTDSDGPYWELMAGSSTDNQPDFSWLQPFETRTFSQYWSPIQEIGPAKNANRLAAVNVEMEGRKLKVGVLTTETFKQLCVIGTAGERVVFNETRYIRLGQPCVQTIELPACCAPPSVLILLLSSHRKEIIRHRLEVNR